MIEHFAISSSLLRVEGIVPIGEAIELLYLEMKLPTKEFFSRHVLTESSVLRGRGYMREFTYKNAVFFVVFIAVVMLLTWQDGPVIVLVKASASILFFSAITFRNQSSLVLLKIKS